MIINILKTIFKAIAAVIIAFFALFGSGFALSYIKFCFSKEGQTIANNENLCDRCAGKKLAKEYLIEMANQIDI